MKNARWTAICGCLIFTAAAGADDGRPFKLAVEPQRPSVYALPTPPPKDEGANTGGVNIDIKVTYFSDYYYRGVDRSSFISDVTTPRTTNTANFQFDGRLQFNLDKLPHPFIGIFANVLDSDPVSNFQEFRPYFGVEWRVRPLILAGGVNIYEFPDRSELSTSEGWVKITLDDSMLFKTDEPVLSPYIFAAYDYDLYDGWYIEAGVSHDFAIEGTDITITPLANVAYVASHGAFAGPTGRDSGFQHYEIGVIGRYALNNLLNIPQRYGTWSLNGYLYYTDSIDDDVRGDSAVWGGVGIQFRY